MCYQPSLWHRLHSLKTCSLQCHVTEAWSSLRQHACVHAGHSNKWPMRHRTQLTQRLRLLP